MTKQELCELTVTEVTAIIKIAAAGLNKDNPKAAQAMNGCAAALERKKADIARNTVESIGGESPDFSRVVNAASALIADVRRRHPGEPLKCPLMIELEASIS